MIRRVKREDCSSEEEYQIAVKAMLDAIEEHNKANPEPKYNPNYKEDFLKTLLNE